MYKKKVYKYKNGVLKVEEKVCHPKALPSQIRYLAPYWHQAFENVLRYQKQRNLQEVHKLVDNSRIEKGLELYRNGHISEIVVTTENQGDVNAIVLSEDKKIRHRVVMKNFLPEKEKFPQYNHEREQYITDLLVTCSCDDHMINRYSSNVSTLCKHCCAIIWFLIFKHDMIKIFITPEERAVGYQKSDVEELDIEIRALPLVKFSQHLNILLLKKYQGMYPALSLSLHRVNNITHCEESKPNWLTYTELKDVERIIAGVSMAYRHMLESRNVPGNEINKKFCSLLKVKPEFVEKSAEVLPKKKWWMFWKHINR